MTGNIGHMTYNIGQYEADINMVLGSLLGSKNAERVLIFLFARDEGYAREISRYYDVDLDPIQKQLEKLEYGGVLISRAIGKTRQYSFNPRYPFQKELKNLLDRALSFYPEDERDKLLMNRRRPRRSGKKL